MAGNHTRHQELLVHYRVASGTAHESQRGRAKLVPCIGTILITPRHSLEKPVRLKTQKHWMRYQLPGRLNKYHLLDLTLSSVLHYRDVIPLC
jgi:hypothetical protein